MVLASWLVDDDTYSLHGQMMNAYFVDGTSHAYTVFVENSSQTNNTLQPKDPTGVKAAINAAGGFGNNGFFYDFTTPQTCGLKFDDLLGGQWRGINNYAGTFNTGFVRTGSSARTNNNSSTFFSGRHWQTGSGGSIQPSGLRSHEGEVFNPFHSDLTIEGWFYIPENNNVLLVLIISLTLDIQMVVVTSPMVLHYISTMVILNCGATPNSCNIYSNYY